MRAVVFDYFGTLTRTGPDEYYRRTRGELAALLGVDPDRFHAELSATSYERYRGAGGSVAGALAWVARRLGVEPTQQQLQQAAALRLTHTRDDAAPRPEAVEVLTAVRARGLRVGVISDCGPELGELFHTLPVAPLVDAPVFSFLERCGKPDPDNYLLCCRRLGVEPGECLYVGDGGSNELAGARAVGMRAVHLSVAAEAGGMVFGRHAAWDGESITSLAGVLDLL